MFKKRGPYYKKPKYKKSATRSSQTETDEAYRERKKREQMEIDKILDKIKQSGYDSLTAEEKRKLFDQSKQ
jgi:RNA polymerase-binding transcription factor DksA